MASLDQLAPALLRPLSKRKSGSCRTAERYRQENDSCTMRRLAFGNRHGVPIFSASQVLIKD
jgi:hypothetical protein